MVVGILVLGGLGAVALQGSQDKNTNIETRSISFSEPRIKDENGYVSINLDESDSFIINQNKPLLPKYTEVFKFPFGTKIKSVSCTPSQIYEKTLTKTIEPSPEPVLVGTVSSETSKNNLNYGTDPYPKYVVRI